jgi:hypothetical protein
MSRKTNTRIVTREQLAEASMVAEGSHRIDALTLRHVQTAGMCSESHMDEADAIFAALPQPAPADGEPRTAAAGVRALADALDSTHDDARRILETLQVHGWHLLAAQPSPGLDEPTLNKAIWNVLRREDRGSSLFPEDSNAIADEYARLRGGT